MIIGKDNNGSVVPELLDKGMGPTTVIQELQNVSKRYRMVDEEILGICKKKADM